jgi:hypothetical protein
MNIDAKILNKIMANQINNMAERSFTMIQSASSQGCRGNSIAQIYKCNTAH